MLPSPSAPHTLSPSRALSRWLTPSVSLALSLSLCLSLSFFFVISLSVSLSLCVSLSLSVSLSRSLSLLLQGLEGELNPGVKVLDERTTENAHPYQKVWMWSVLDCPRLQRRGQADLCPHQSQHLIFLEPRFPLHLSGVLHNLSKPVSNKAANLQHSRLRFPIEPGGQWPRALQRRKFTESVAMTSRVLSKQDLSTN